MASTFFKKFLVKVVRRSLNFCSLAFGSNQRPRYLNSPASWRFVIGTLLIFRSVLAGFPCTKLWAMHFWGFAFIRDQERNCSSDLISNFAPAFDDVVSCKSSAKAATNSWRDLLLNSHRVRWV